MNAIMIVAFAAAFVMGICIGLGCGIIMCYSKRIGNLVVDSTDEDGPFLFLELDEKPEIFSKEKYVTLAIKKRGYFEE